MGKTDIKTKDQVLAELKRHAPAMRRLGVKRLGLFGSAARGEVKTSSDLDFLVELERETFDAYMDVKEFLEDLFNRPVDLVLSSGLKPRLKPYIEKDLVYVQDLGTGK